MNNELDQEWVELIVQAREIELSLNEIRDFLQKTRQQDIEMALVNK